MVSVIRGQSSMFLPFQREGRSKNQTNSPATLTLAGHLFPVPAKVKTRVAGLQYRRRARVISPDGFRVNSCSLREVAAPTPRFHRCFGNSRSNCLQQCARIFGEFYAFPHPEITPCITIRSVPVDGWPASHLACSDFRCHLPAIQNHHAANQLLAGLSDC